MNTVDISMYKKSLDKFKNIRSTNNEFSCYPIEKDFNTIYKRISIIEKIVKSESKEIKIPCLISKLNTEKYVTEWIISGLSKIEQDYIFLSNINDDTLEHFIDQEEKLQKKSYSLILSDILLKDDFNCFMTSEQERHFIFREIFPRFGISSDEKYKIIRRLYLEKFINTSHFELFCNDDIKINHLVRMFIEKNEENLPMFSCDLNKIKNDLISFHNSKDVNKLYPTKYKFTKFARNMYGKLHESDILDINCELQ